jgi:hypothetical protein
MMPNGAKFRRIFIAADRRPLVIQNYLARPTSTLSSSKLERSRGSIFSLFDIGGSSLVRKLHSGATQHCRDRGQLILDKV